MRWNEPVPVRSPCAGAQLACTLPQDVFNSFVRALLFISAATLVTGAVPGKLIFLQQQLSLPSVEDRGNRSNAARPRLGH